MVQYRKKSGIYTKEPLNYNPEKKLIQDKIRTLDPPTSNEARYLPKAIPNPINDEPWYRSNAKDWNTQYRFFSSPPADKLLYEDCWQFHTLKNKSNFDRARNATDKLADAELACRPTGAAKAMLLNGPGSLDVYNCVDADGRRTFAADKVMQRCHEYVKAGQKAGFIENTPTWSKYKYFSGGHQNTDRFESWRGHVDPNQDCVRFNSQT